MGVRGHEHAERVYELFRKKDDDQEKGKKTLTGRCGYCGKRKADQIVKTNRIFKIWQFIVGKIRTLFN